MKMWASMRAEQMIDRADRQIAFEVAERLFDSSELQVIAPQLSGIAA